MKSSDWRTTSFTTAGSVTEPVHAETRSPWSLLPAALTVLVALSFLGFGFLHPALNFDLIPYATLAKEMRGAGGKDEVYRELAAKMGPARFENAVSAPYEKKMHEDDAFFAANLPFYEIRPLYIFLCSAAGLLIGNDAVATYAVSAIAAALAVLVSYAIVRMIGIPAGPWRLAAPLSWIVAGGLPIAALSTPDAVAALVGLLFVQAWLAEHRTGGRAIWLILLAGLIVAARTDAILFAAPLLLGEALLDPRRRAVALVALAAAAVTYAVIQKTTGNYGYIAILNFTMIDGPQKLLVPDLVPHPLGYVRAVAGGILQLLSEGDGGIFLLAASFLALVSVREWRLRRAPDGNAFDRRILILACGLIFFLIAHFVLFPLPTARFFLGPYVLAGLLFARAAQRDFASRR